MTRFIVARASIARIEEIYLPVYRPRDIFPEYTDGIAAEHGHWMPPSLRSGPRPHQAQRAQLASHDRQDEHPDRLLLRQQQAPAGASVLEYARHAISRTARHGRRATAGHRLRDVHASPHDHFASLFDPRRQRHRPAARPPEWKRHRLRPLRGHAQRQLAVGSVFD